MNRWQLVLCLWLAGCGSGGFSDALSLQDQAAQGARKPNPEPLLAVAEQLSLSFQRGAIVSTFKATLAADAYPPVLETDAGTFYLAPWGGFQYEVKGDPQSVIGGIFVRRSDNTPMVWYAPNEGSESDWTAWRDGHRIAGVKPGLANIASRPWIEADFKIPADKISLK